MQDSLFFIGIFVFVFIVWIVTGGPNRPLSHSGALLPSPGAVGGGNYLALPTSNSAGGSTGFSVKPVSSGYAANGTSGTTGSPTLKNISAQIVQTNNQVNQLKTQVNQVVAFGTPSPYRGKVTISHRVTNAGALKPQSEYVQISVSTGSGPVNISGWTLKSEVTGARAAIPYGTEVPRSGIVNAVEPITLQPGNWAIVSTGRSPVGASFRENKCIGYFSQYQTFTPSIPNACPVPSSELSQWYGPDLIRDPNCIDYVAKLKRCTIPPPSPAYLTTSCKSVISTYLNYNGCVVAHSGDIDFKNKEWRVYLGKDTSLWRKTHEVIKLLDTEGKTVDMFSY